jgi:hypothetical protein
MDETALQSQLQAARDELRYLERELPNFVRLRDENQRLAEAARAGKADAVEQAKAFGRLSTARELLSQHESDIAAARDFVSDLERELERLEVCKRIRQIYLEVEYGAETWAEEAFAALNNFVESALDLGRERHRLMDLTAEARKLRERLAFGLEPGARAALYAELEVTEPDSLRDYGPQTWLPRNLTAPLEPVQAPVVTAFERLLTMPRPNRDGLRIKPKGDRTRFDPSITGAKPLQPAPAPSSPPQTTTAARAGVQHHGVQDNPETLTLEEPK